MAMRPKISVDRFSKEDLTHELAIYGIRSVMVEVMRSKLRGAPKINTKPLEKYPFDFTSEMEVLKANLKELRVKLGSLEGKEVKDGELKGFETKVAFNLRRAVRLPVDNEEQQNSKNMMVAELEVVLGEYLIMKEGEAKEGVVAERNEEVEVENINSSLT